MGIERKRRDGKTELSNTRAPLNYKFISIGKAIKLRL